MRRSGQDPNSRIQNFGRRECREARREQMTNRRMICGRGTKYKSRAGPYMLDLREEGVGWGNGRRKEKDRKWEESRRGGVRGMRRAVLIKDPAI